MVPNILLEVYGRLACWPVVHVLLALIDDHVLYKHDNPDVILVELDVAFCLLE